MLMTLMSNALFGTSRAQSHFDSIVMLTLFLNENENVD